MNVLKWAATGASLAALALAVNPAVAGSHGDGLKVGMITTLSGGGAGLGIDVRDGFMLAIKQSGADNIEVVIEDDQRKGTRSNADKQ